MAERNKLEQVNNPPEETVCNDDVDMTVESLRCTICEFRYSFCTSKKAEKMRSYDINKRSVYAFRRLGKGYAGMKTFLTIMNLPPPMTKKN